MISHFEMLLRLALGSCLGGAIGFERDRHRRQAGLRDHFLVGLASATFMVVSAHFYFFQHYGSTSGIGADPSRIAASVVTGIGFLAGGAILKTGLTVQGLTTAAGLWLVAAIGLCAGAGMYPEAVTVTVMGLTALTLFRIFQEKHDHAVPRKVTLTLAETRTLIPAVFAQLAQAGTTVQDYDFEQVAESGNATISFEIDLPTQFEVSALVNLLETFPGVLGVQVRRW